MATKKAVADKAQDQGEKKVAEEQDQGYRGVAVDPTPNEHYTVDGVIAGKPTPETNADARLEARKALGLHQ